MKQMIPLSVPNLKGNEEKYVVEAIRQEWVSTAGAYITRFEEALAKYVGTGSAVACQSGTAGIHLALLAAGVAADMEVIVPTLTFIAAVNPVKYVGAEPIFMDCDDTLCMDMDKVQHFCETCCTMQEGKLIHQRTKKHVKAMIVVHVFGNLAAMEKAQEISERYNLILIEDATEALGTYQVDANGQKHFAGTFGDYGVYSFNGNKIITCGGGGMVVARDEERLQYIQYLSTQAKDDPIGYVHHAIGYNYRMTNVQAAIGLAQLEQLDAFIQTKATRYRQYQDSINRLEGVALLSFREDIYPNYWFYSLQLEKLQPLTRQMLLEKLQEQGVQTRAIWGLIHEQKPYQDAMAYEIQKASYYYERILNIPCSSALTEEQVTAVIEALTVCLDDIE